MLASVNISEANLTHHIQSLKYASIIQRGLLPKKRHFNRHVSDHFVFFKPLNFVSGDFYWIGGKDGLVFAAVGDCTGHGVPGAMLSILARNILEYSIMSKSIFSTDKVLRELDKKFIESFFHVREEEYNNDWVDIAFVCIDTKRSIIEFSSANRKILHVGKNGATVYAGSSYPIGGWQIETNRKFERVQIPYEPGDALYMGSDGYQDQIGGDRLKKFSSRKLHELLSDNYHHPMNKQKMILVKTLSKWQGKEDQIDDICVMGLRL